MVMKLVAFAFLFTFTVNGQESSLAAATQSTVDTEETSPAPSITPMTSITIDQPQGQYSDTEKEKVRLEQLLEQLTAKEKELSILREKTAAAANQVTVEKTRAEALEAQLTQKEQEFAGLCTQRDSHQQMSQDLNRSRSSLELARQQVFDIERQYATSSDQLDTAMQRIADLDLQLVAKEQEFQLAKANMETEIAMRDSQLVQAKRLLTSLGKSLPKPVKLQPYNKTLASQPTITTARATTDLGKVGEKLANALQDDLKRGAVVMEQRGDKLTLALPSGELFGTGRVTMTQAGNTLVKRIGVALRKLRPQSVEVAGHTDSIPVKYNPRRPFKDNTELSRARAENAGKALVKGGLGADRVKAVGYADTYPIATNDTEEGRSKNRRVEIVVTQTPEPMASISDKDEQVVRNTKGTSQYNGSGMVQKIATR